MKVNSFDLKTFLLTMFFNGYTENFFCRFSKTFSPPSNTAALWAPAEGLNIYALFTEGWNFIDTLVPILFLEHEKFSSFINNKLINKTMFYFPFFQVDFSIFSLISGGALCGLDSSKKIWSKALQWIVHTIYRHSSHHIACVLHFFVYLSFLAFWILYWISVLIKSFGMIVNNQPVFT